MPADAPEPPRADVVAGVAGFGLVFTALGLGGWVVFGDPPSAVGLAAVGTAVVSTGILSVVAFRGLRRRGQDRLRSFGRAVWEGVKLLFSFP